MCVKVFSTICGNRQMALVVSKFEVARFDGTANFWGVADESEELVGSTGYLESLQCEEADEGG